MSIYILIIVLTIVAYQLILFVLAVTDKLDNEKVLATVCGVWSLFIIFIRVGYKIYKKLQLTWFNKNYSYCTFYDSKTKKQISAYVKHQDNNALLNFDMNKRYYVRFDYQHKAKSLYGINVKKNAYIINDLLNPPSGFTTDFLKKYME